MGISKIYESLQDYDKAIAQFEKTLEIDSKCTEGYEALEEFFEKLGKYEEAIEAYQKYICHLVSGDKKQFKSIRKKIKNLKK